MDEFCLQCDFVVSVELDIYNEGMCPREWKGHTEGWLGLEGPLAVNTAPEQHLIQRAEVRGPSGVSTRDRSDSEWGC